MQQTIGVTAITVRQGKRYGMECGNRAVGRKRGALLCDGRLEKSYVMTGGTGRSAREGKDLLVEWLT